MGTAFYMYLCMNSSLHGDALSIDIRYCERKMLQTVSYRVSKELFAYADTADVYVQCNGPFVLLIYAEFMRIISAYPTVFERIEFLIFVETLVSNEIKSLYGLDRCPDCCMFFVAHAKSDNKLSITLIEVNPTSRNILFITQPA